MFFLISIINYLMIRWRNGSVKWRMLKSGRGRSPDNSGTRSRVPITGRCIRRSHDVPRGVIRRTPRGIMIRSGRPRTFALGQFLASCNSNTNIKFLNFQYLLNWKFSLNFKFSYHLERLFPHWDHRWRRFRNTHIVLNHLPIFAPLNHQSHGADFHWSHLQKKGKNE